MISDFIQKVFALCIEFDGSVTSWGRTPERNRLVGGHLASFHKNWLAIDVILDDMGDNNVRHFIEKAVRMGIRAIDEREKGHLHLQVEV